MDHSYFDDGSWSFGQALRQRASAWLRPHHRERGPESLESLRHRSDAIEIDALGPEPRRAQPAVDALALVDVVHSYGQVRAVDGVRLELAAGEILCLVGPSGCGKSTLLRLAAGLECLQEGEVRIAGHVVADRHGGLAPEHRGVGLVFQDYALFPHLSVLDNVRFGLTALSGDQQRRRALETLAQVGMADYADAFPHALSGGQQQRVALARALAPKPGVLLLDEPFSGLDARLREQIRDETLHVLKRNGAATLLVTHDPEEAMFLGDRIALMDGGHLVQVGTPVELYTRPVDAFAATFFGEVNRIAGMVRGGQVDTAVGAIRTNLPEGTPAEVLVRPEALRLEPVQTGSELPVLGRVEAARLLGRTSLIHLSVPDGRGATLHLHSRMPGQFLPAEGSHVSILLDPQQAFVFQSRSIYNGMSA